MRCVERLLVSAGMLALAWSFAPRVQAAGLRSVGDGFLLCPAETAALLTTAAAAPNPFGVWAAAGQARLWGLPDLPAAELGVGVAVPAFGGVAGAGLVWERLGRDLVRMDEARGWIGWRRGWEVRVEAERRTLVIDGSGAPERPDVALSAGPDLELPGGAQLRLRAWVALTPEDPGSRRPRAAVRAVLAAGGLACAVALDRSRRPGPALGAELAVAAAGAATLGLRWDGASCSLGPGVGLRVGPCLLRTSHTVHPALGVTHRFELTGGALGAARW